MFLREFHSRFDEFASGFGLATLKVQHADQIHNPLTPTRDA
jgi:hypothetical protein